jgi:hypothetical protein
MIQRFPIIVQFLRFGLVGTAGFVMDSAVLLAMLALGVGPYAGRVASYLAAASLTFALTFGSATLMEEMSIQVMYLSTPLLAKTLVRIYQ